MEASQWTKPHEMIHEVTMSLIVSSVSHLQDNQSRFRRSGLKTHYLDILNKAQLASWWFHNIDTPQTQAYTLNLYKHDLTYMVNNQCN